MTITLDIPDEAAQRVAALPDEERRVLGQKMSDFLLNVLPPVYDDAPNEPVDEAFIAELRDAFAEAERVGTIAFEDVLQRIEAEDKSAAAARKAAKAIPA